jgi:hypothetical protein
MDVSVLMPSYEYGRFIAACIESVIQQQSPSTHHPDAGLGGGACGGHTPPESLRPLRHLLAIATELGLTPVSNTEAFD